jgi:DNA-binding NarL/FixJ family response regulator
MTDLGGIGGTSTPLHVAIVDDHRLLADVLALALQDRGIRVTLPDLGPPDELTRAVLEARPDLVLLDLDLGDAGNGSTLVRPLVEGGLRVLMVTAALDLEQVADALAHGAIGMVPKNGPFQDLVRSVVDAAQGREVMAPRDRLRLLDDARRRRDGRTGALAPFARLTQREAEVLRELMRGRTVAEIARASVVSEATVRSQVQAVLMKLGVRSQLEAVVAAQRSGWS